MNEFFHVKTMDKDVVVILVKMVTNKELHLTSNILLIKLVAGSSHISSQPHISCSHCLVWKRCSVRCKRLLVYYIESRNTTHPTTAYFSPLTERFSCGLVSATSSYKNRKQSHRLTI